MFLKFYSYFISIFWWLKFSGKNFTKNNILHQTTNKFTVSWGSRIRRLHFWKGKEPPPNECYGYDTKPSDGAAPALELQGMWSTPSLPLLSVFLWPFLVVHFRALYIGQIELFKYLTCKLTLCKRMRNVE